MSKKIITVVGATGIQGGSVVDALLKANDSSTTIRALTRNPSSDAAKALATKGIQVVAADTNDLPSLTSAFHGSTAIFAVTDFSVPFIQGGADYAMKVEAEQGINLAKAASATSTLEHYVWSTVPHSKELSGGKIIVPHFESKVPVDEYIKSDAALLAKTTFLVTTFYAENFLHFPMIMPMQVPGTGKYIQLQCTASDAPFKAIGHARTNIGLFVRAIFEQREKVLPGKVFNAYTESTTPAKMLQIWSKVKGKDAHCIRVERETFNALWPAWGEDFALMMELFEQEREKVYSDEGRLTKEDLGVEGLVDIESTFRNLAS